MNEYGAEWLLGWCVGTFVCLALYGAWLKYGWRIGEWLKRLKRR
jgi:hypothetical protein